MTPVPDYRCRLDYEINANSTKYIRLPSSAHDVQEQLKQSCQSWRNSVFGDSPSRTHPFWLIWPLYRAENTKTPSRSDLSGNAKATVDLLEEVCNREDFRIVLATLTCIQEGSCIRDDVERVEEDSSARHIELKDINTLAGVHVGTHMDVEPDELIASDLFIEEQCDEEEEEQEELGSPPGDNYGEGCNLYDCSDDGLNSDSVSRRHRPTRICWTRKWQRMVSKNAKAVPTCVSANILMW